MSTDIPGWPDPDMEITTGHSCAGCCGKDWPTRRSCCAQQIAMDWWKIDKMPAIDPDERVRLRTAAYEHRSNQRLVLEGPNYLRPNHTCERCETFSQHGQNLCKEAHIAAFTQLGEGFIRASEIANPGYRIPEQGFAWLIQAAHEMVLAQDYLNHLYCQPAAMAERRARRDARLEAEARAKRAKAWREDPVGVVARTTWTGFVYVVMGVLFAGLLGMAVLGGSGASGDDQDAQVSRPLD
jgi:hypothetical protein